MSLFRELSDELGHKIPSESSSGIPWQRACCAVHCASPRRPGQVRMRSNPSFKPTRLRRSA